jgi:RNA polymerase sigma factor (sigma-70 family)
VDEANDSELLRRYSDARDERAFAELVSRHVGLVYSVAVRVVVDPHLAEDATQATFGVVAKEARRLSSHPQLSSWLHRTAYNHAAKLVRTEMRRRAREQESYKMQATESAGGESVWERVGPHLDAALDRLSDKDRKIILLRFFEKKKAHEIGSVFKLSEAAVQKRLSRAVARLRTLVGAENISFSSFSLMLEAGTMASVPTNLSASVTAAALTGCVAVNGAGLATLKLIIMSKLKISAVSAILVAGVATPIFWQHQALKHLRKENAQLGEQVQLAEKFRAENEALLRGLAAKREQEPLSKGQFSELMRLRSEVGLLRKDNQELARLRTPALQRPVSREEYLPAAAWANVGIDKPESAIQTFFWAGKQGDTNVLGNLLRWQRDPAIPASDQLDEKFTASMISGSAQFAKELEGFRITTVDSEGEEMRVGLEITNDTGNTETHLLRLVHEEQQWFPVMHVFQEGPGSIHASLDVPRKFRNAN